MKGYVYVMTNKAMPGLVKIGKTKRDPEARATELFQTGVPEPFMVYASVFSPDCGELEAKLHRKLDDQRLSSRREFFFLSAEEAERVLIDEHREQVEFWLDQFIPDQYIIPSEQFIDVACLADAARPLGVHPFEAIAALEFITAEEFAPCVQRYRERQKRILAKGERYA